MRGLGPQVKKLLAQKQILKLGKEKSLGILYSKKSLAEQKLNAFKRPNNVLNKLEFLILVPVNCTFINISIK